MPPTIKPRSLSVVRCKIDLLSTQLFPVATPKYGSANSKFGSGQMQNSNINLTLTNIK